MEIELYRTAEDELSREIWLYRVAMGYAVDTDLSVTLVRFERQGRATKRHKWAKTGTGFHRVWHAKSRRDFGYELPADKVPVLDGADEQIRAEIMRRMKITHAEEPDGGH